MGRRTEPLHALKWETFSRKTCMSELLLAELNLSRIFHNLKAL